MKTMHVAVAQIHSGGGVRDVLKRMTRQIRIAAIAGVDVILFSECVLQGYDYDLTRKQLEQIAVTAGSRPCGRLKKLAAEYGMTIIAGFFERERGAFYNSCLIVHPDGSRQVQRKHALTAGEKRAGLTPGPREREIIDINGIKCAVLICADGGIEGIYNDLKQQGVQYRFCPTGGGGKMSEMINERSLSRKKTRDRYIENRPRVFNADAILANDQYPDMPFASANALGPVGKRTCHQGHCMITGADYVMRAQIPGTIVLEHQEDQMLHACLNLD